MILKGKTVLITGGGRGIGKAIALSLSNEGCNIAVSSRNADELESVTNEANAAGVGAFGLPLDLTVEKNVEELVMKTVERFGTIDILINAAGYAKRVPFLEETMEEFEKNLAINLKSAFYLSQKVLKLMMQRQSGYIINISSTVALGVPSFHAAYGSSKCGFTGLSQAMYETAAKHNIKVSTIYPDYTDTKMLRDIDPPVDSGLWLLPEDIAYCVLFLLKSSDRLVLKEIVTKAFLVDVNR